MSCSDIIAIVAVVISVFSVPLSYWFSMRQTKKEIRLEVYSEILSILYDLKSNPGIFLSNENFIAKLKSSRAKIRLFSDKEAFGLIDEVYNEMGKRKSKYVNMPEPTSEEELALDESYNLCSLSDDYVSDKIDQLVECAKKSMRF